MINKNEMQFIPVDKDRLIQNIKQIIEEQGITQQELGQVMGRNASSITRMMHQEYDFSLDDIKALYDRYNVDLNYLIGEDGKASLYRSKGDDTSINRFDYYMNCIQLEINKAPKNQYEHIVDEYLMLLKKIVEKNKDTE